jgi:chromosome segregation ATPase
LKDEKNALAADINEIRGNLVAVFSQNESIKKELDDEKTAHNETKSHLKNCEQQLENDKNDFSVELCKVISIGYFISFLII